MSLGEPFLRPTSMLYRNLAAMEIEEQIRANPIDAVVLLTGCDKTTPAALMGAASAGVPAIVLTGGPMLNGRFKGRNVGSGTDIWRMTEELRAGTISQEEFTEFESSLNRSAGHCMTMGTASTMACLTEALGMMLPGGSGLPAVDARRGTLAEETGARAVALAGSDLTPRRIMTRAAFENAVRINAAIGGSTNAVVHLLALAGRLGVPLELDDFDRLGAELPLLIDLMPSGRFLMEEFAYAGGLPALVNDLRDALHQDTVTVTGLSLTANCVGAQVYDRDVIRAFDNPVLPAGRGRPWFAAASPRTVPSSSCRPPRRTCWTTPAPLSSSTPSRTTSPLPRTPHSMSAPRRCSSCATPARAVTRACPRWATCRCRRGCWTPGSGTWCGYPMPACPERPSERAFCTWRRRRRSAVRWRSSAPATKSGSTSPADGSTC